MTLDDERDRVTSTFLDRVGRPPEVIAAAPGRVNLIGEHTDYNGGFVLPIAINRRAVVALARRPDTLVTGWSRQLGDAEQVELRAGDVPRASGWIGYVAGAAWAVTEETGAVTGIDVMVDSDLPVGGGLSSSAALSCATALAVATVTDAGLSAIAIAKAAQRAEHDVVGAPVGLMDQMMAMLGRCRTALLLDCRSLATEHVPLDLAASGFNLLVIDTGVRHDHAAGGYAERRRQCEAAAAALGVASLRDAGLDDVGRLDGVLLRRARHVLSENERVQTTVAALRRNDYDAVGAAMIASHGSLRDDFEVSTIELDVAVEAALSAGAVGARMNGGGFGGAAIALVPSARADPAAEAVEAAFAARSFAPPSVFAVAPDDGASCWTS